MFSPAPAQRRVSGNNGLRGSPGPNPGGPLIGSRQQSAAPRIPGALRTTQPPQGQGIGHGAAPLRRGVGIGPFTGGAGGGGGSRLPTPARGGVGSRLASVDVMMDFEGGTPSATSSIYGGTVGGPSLGRLFACSDEISVGFHGWLPVEVDRTLRHAEDKSATGHIDPVTQHAFLLSSTPTANACFVWGLAPSLGSSTCYIFPIDPLPASASSSTSSSNKPPISVASLVPFGPSREPGLIIVSPVGLVRFWSSITTGLSGAEQFEATQLPLSPASSSLSPSSPATSLGEVILSIIRVEPMIYVVSTSHGRLFRLTVSSAAPGRFAIVAKEVTRPKSIFSRFFFGGGSNASSGGGLFGPEPVKSVTLGPSLRGGVGRDVWVMTTRLVQRWRLSADGWEELLMEQDIREVLTTFLLTGRAESSEDLFRELNLELLALGVTDHTDLIVLASYTPKPKGSNNTTPAPTLNMRTYAAIYLEATQGTNTSAPAAGTGTQYEVTQVDVLPYSTVMRMENTAASPGKLLLLNGGKVIMVVFDDAVVVSSDGAHFQDIFYLKEEPSTRRHFLGSSAPSTSPSAGGGTLLTMAMGSQTPSGASAAAGRAANEVMLMISGGMMMLDVKLDLQRIIDTEAAASQAGDDTVMSMSVSGIGDEGSTGASRVRSIMTQAILYGPIAENPFEFRFAHDVNGHHLMAAAEQLSREILGSSPELLKPALDVRAQIADRASRLNWLIHFINDNAALGKLSISSRQRLSSDAEKLSSAGVLWHHHNARIASSRAGSVVPHPEVRPNGTGAERSLLGEAIETYMYEMGEKAVGEEDLIRAFFKTKIHDIQLLMPHFVRIVQNTLASYHLSSQWPDALLEANRLVLKLLNAAFTFRRQHQEQYGIDETSHLTSCPWTSEAVHLEILGVLFDSTASQIQERTRELGGAAATNDGLTELKAQSRDLASVWFVCVTERLSWLQRTMPEAGNERTHQDLQEQFAVRRPAVLRTLLNIDSAEHAFKLAEEYRDFRTLTELCHETRASNGAFRVQSYIEKFKEPFAFELYQWYIEKGRVKAMFDQDPAYSALLDKFFENYHNPRISWLHSINKGSYSAASSALLDESRDETKLAAMHLMLSVGKLCEFAQLTQEDVAHLEPVQEIEVFDDGLDFVSVHSKLREDLESCLASQPLHVRNASVDIQVDGIAKILAKGLLDNNRPAFYSLFKQLAASLLQGQALRTEDLVDLLTLKDNTEDAADFGPALSVLVRATNVPEARKRAALRAIWRRVFIRDDWHALQDTASLSDDQVADSIRTTALYATLSQRASYASYLSTPTNANFGSPPDFPRDAILSPHDAMIVPTTEEVATRFSGLPDHEVQLLEADYEQERIRLESYFSVLEVRWEQVMTLEKQDHPAFDGA